jgi:NAD(P)-dependent dehydrogenase (short-subunit alcohol dehydrogenase family)
MAQDRLAGKVAIITGAGSGIGWAAARWFADEGARVVCADVSGQEREIAAGSATSRCRCTLTSPTPTTSNAWSPPPSTASAGWMCC